MRRNFARPPAPFDTRYRTSEREPFDPGPPEPEIDSERLAPWLRGLRDLERPTQQCRGEIDYLDEQLGRAGASPPKGRPARAGRSPGVRQHPPG